MPKYNIYEISPPPNAENVNPDEPPKRVMAVSEKQAIDLVQNAIILGTCFRYMKLGEVPWLGQDVVCTLVEENVDNPDGCALLLESKPSS